MQNSETRIGQRITNKENDGLSRNRQELYNYELKCPKYFSLDLLWGGFFTLCTFLGRGIEEEEEEEEEETTTN